MKDSQTCCGHCGEGEATFHCGKCQHISYCSSECHQADWKFHKHLCADSVNLEQRSNKNLRRVIYLPGNADKAEFRWMTVTREKLSDSKKARMKAVYGFEINKVFEPRDGEGYFADYDKGFLKELNVSINSSVLIFESDLAKRVGHNFQVLYDDNFLSSGYPTHRCLARLVGNEAAKRWLGPLVISTVALDNADDTFDAETSDFTHAIEALVDYHKYGPKEPTNLKLDIASMTLHMDDSKVVKPIANSGPPKKVAGAKMITTTPTFKPVNVPVRHPIFTKGKLSDVSAAVDLPVLTLEVRQSKAGDASNGQGDLRDLATIDNLNISLDASAPDFGSILKSFTKASGSDVLIAGPGKTPIAADDIRKLCKAIERHKIFLHDATKTPVARRALFIAVLANTWKHTLLDETEQQIKAEPKDKAGEGQATKAKKMSAYVEDDTTDTTTGWKAEQVK